MNDGQALLACICALDCQTAEEKRARWDDDAPRLVYADWLDEHGEPERAEFLRVQCEDERLCRRTDKNGRWAVGLRSHRGKAAFERALELERHFSQTWFPFDGIKPYWSRGFVDFVTCSAADCLAYLDAIRLQHPVREARLTSGLNPFQIGGIMADCGYQANQPELIEHGRGFYDDPLPLLNQRWPGITFHLPPEPERRGTVFQESFPRRTQQSPHDRSV